MNVAVLMIAALILIALAYRVYSRVLARSFGEDPARITPALEHKDGVDYCPTKSPVVFAHHFASIAGAGPILGPTLAILYGVGPVWFWVLIGGIFIGAVHDYATLFVSIRERGRSIAEIARRSLGDAGFGLMIAFTILMVVLVTSAFLVASATSLTSLVPLAKLGLSADQGLIKTVDKAGVLHGQIGGIASTSVIIITLFAPLIGWLNYRRNAPVWISTAIAVSVCLISVLIGMQFPISLSVNVWMILLAVYSLLAAGVPVWILLQPRDFTNVFVLYGGLALLVIGALGAGFQGATIAMPLSNVAAGSLKAGPIWPFLFITVACGAISGFHALVAGGTISKQITSEKSARPIAFGGMLLESILAVGVICALACGISFVDYQGIVFPAEGKSNPILAFALAMAGLLSQGLHVPMAFGVVFGILLVEGFVATTLDTAVRINRYLFEELWAILFKNPHWVLKTYAFNSGLSVALMLLLAFTNAFNAIWPVFGTANQLLAALTLITLTIWFAARKKKIAFTLAPAVFMILTTTYSLVLLMKRYLQTGNKILLAADVLLLALSIGLVVVAVKTVLRLRAGSAGLVQEAESAA